jgi:hypothetical protein
MSQIVGTQAVFNVLTGKRWSVVSKEMKDYLCGYYGKAPGPIKQEVLDKVVGDSERLDPTWPRVPWSPPRSTRLPKRSAILRRPKKTS